MKVGTSLWLWDGSIYPYLSACSSISICLYYTCLLVHPSFNQLVYVCLYYTCLLVYPSIYLSMSVYTIPVCLFIHPSIYLFMSVYTCLLVYPILSSTCLCLYYTCLLVYVCLYHTCLLVHPSNCLSVHLCIHAPICLIYVNQTAVDLMLLIIQIHVCENMCKYQIWTIQTQPTIVNISLRETHDVDGNFWLWNLNTVQCSHDCIHIGNLITVHLCGSYKSWYSNAHDSRAYWSVVLRWSVVPFPWLGFQKLLPDVVATLAQT